MSTLTVGTQQLGVSLATPQRPRSSVHLPQLDGVRGMAILMVMMVHMGMILRATGIGRFFEFGWCGVDLFFALSGFLITRILVRSRTHEHYWWSFYSRRVLRIWPLYYAYLIGNLLLVNAIGHFVDVSAMVQSLPTIAGGWPAIASFVVVHITLAQNLNPATGFSSRDFAAITWSLCIEEHFYLIWPFLIRRLSIVRLRYAMGTLLLLLPAARLVAYFALRHHMAYDDYYQMVTRFTPFHLDGLAVGSLLALFWNEADPRRYRRLFAGLFGGGLLATIALMVLAQSNAAFAFTFSALAATFAGFIGLALCGWKLPILTNPGLRYTGKISYGLYLIHPSVYWIFQAHSLYARFGLGRHVYVAEIVAALLAVAVSYAIATLSWRYFESPILKLKDRLAPE